jgi:tRNA modification GTPase
MTTTIAAIATAVGRGAMSILRLSGPDALTIADNIFRGRELPSESGHKSILIGRLVDPAGEPLDRVVLLVMRGPKSYTGEDLVEITCHGGSISPRIALKRLIDEGARPAEPGEFTKRAFLNGKMDLTQAEAVCEIVQAGSERALRAAARQLEGGLSARIISIERPLLEQLALVEANIDFPEDEIDPVDLEALRDSLERAGSELGTLISHRTMGRLLREGIETVIVGRPNVGKSSLFNKLVGHDRVIVSESPGTTRDVVDAVLPIDGVLFNLHDTAGVLEPVDRVEAAAVERTRSALDGSDVVLVVLDAAGPVDAADRDIWRRAEGKRRLTVFNKIDIEDADEHLGEGPEVRVSALEGWGMENLIHKLREMSEDMVADMADGAMANERHAACLNEARAAVDGARKALDSGMPLELIASDLRAALAALGRIKGSPAGEDLLDEIFSRFCIGK